VDADTILTSATAEIIKALGYTKKASEEAGLRFFPNGIEYISIEVNLASGIGGKVVITGPTPRGPSNVEVS